jgi:hypothetical protein
MLKFLIFLLCFGALGLLIEKIVHWDYNLTQVTLSLKDDGKRIVKALISETPRRHAFDFTLVDDIKSILKPYAKSEFEIQVLNDIFRSVPTIGIRFVPVHELDEQEIEEIMHFISIKFREYLSYYGFEWRYSLSYSAGTDYFWLYIYYAEWECDVPSFVNNYRQMVRNKIDKTGGILRDRELEAELANVDKIRV